jgi:general secretion pathway protein K
MSAPRTAAGQQGFALVAVLLVLAFVAVIGAEFAYSMRLEATAARVYKETLIATHLAEAAVEQAIRELVAEIGTVGVGDPSDPEADPGCPIVFYGRNRAPLPRLPHRDVPLGSGQFTYCISDEEARLNLNGPPDRLRRLLEALGVEREERDTIVASIEDWRDPNEEHRLSGAESEDTYLKLPVPYRAKNANFESVAELRQVKGVTARLLEGEQDRPGLGALVTAQPTNTVNINTASRHVLRALNVSDAEFTQIEQARRQQPFAAVPAQFSGRGLGVTTRTFRIEAEGVVGGQVRARLTAIVQKRPGAGGEGVVVVDWSGMR